MNMMPWPIVLVLLAGTAYGHGTGSETLEPFPLGGTMATIEVRSQQVDDMVQIDMGMLGVESQDRINNVTYEITASHGQAVLFTDTFQQGDGSIRFEFVSGPDSPLTEISQGGLFGLLESQRFRMSGQDLGDGGLYEFDIRVLSAGGQSLSRPLDLVSAVSVPISYDLTIHDQYWGVQNMTFWTYYDTLHDVRYDDSAKTASFEMPFQWSPANIREIEAVHVEVFVPQTLGDLLVDEFQARVNGIAIPDDRIVVDDYFENHRIIHVVLLRNSLEDLYNVIGDDDIMEFEVGPAPGAAYSSVTANAQYRILADIRQNAGEVVVSFNITDVYLRSVTVEETYRMDVMHDGAVLHAQSGRSSSNEPTMIRFALPDAVEGTAAVSFYDIGGNPMAGASLPVLLGADDDAVPSWIRTTVQWWVSQSIPDQSFIDAVTHLVQQDIIRVDPVDVQQTQNREIPDWVRTTLGWWTEGKLSDAEFLQAVSYMVEQGLIKLAAD